MQMKKLKRAIQRGRGPLQVILLASGLIVYLVQVSFAELSIKERFEGKEKMTYGVYFNGVDVGKIDWYYLGKDHVYGKEADVLYVVADTKIVQLFNLESEEKIFLDTKTHLPLKVTRNVVFFGKKELITEIYNQDRGFVKLVKKNSRRKEEFLYQDKPIHNILALLYFFPQETKLTVGSSLVFNLPTNKVKIKVDSLKTVPSRTTKKEAYFLLGKGAKKFNLWLDKEERLPLRLEFVLPVGKIAIVKKAN
jgi:hypothetical protein